MPLELSPLLWNGSPGLRVRKPRKLSSSPDLPASARKAAQTRAFSVKFARRQAGKRWRTHAPQYVCKGISCRSGHRSQASFNECMNSHSPADISWPCRVSDDLWTHFARDLGLRLMQQLGPHRSTEGRHSFSLPCSPGLAQRVLRQLDEGLDDDDRDKGMFSARLHRVHAQSVFTR